jgi:hypothetical protein
MSIALAALVLGKAAQISDLLPFIYRFPHKPLAHNVAWKTVIYLLVAAAIHYLERLFDFAKAPGGVAAGNARLMSEIIWPHFCRGADLSLRIDPGVLHFARAEARDRPRTGSAAATVTAAMPGRRLRRVKT